MDIEKIALAWAQVQTKQDLETKDFDPEKELEESLECFVDRYQFALKAFAAGNLADHLSSGD